MFYHSRVFPGPQGWGWCPSQGRGVRVSIPAPFKRITSASIDHFHLIHWLHFSSWPHLTTREAGKFYSGQKLEVYSYGRRSVWMLGACSHLFHGSYIALRSISFSFLFLVTLLSVLHPSAFLFPPSSFYPTPCGTPFYAAGPICPNFTYTISFHHHSRLVREVLIVPIWQMKTLWLRKVE